MTYAVAFLAGNIKAWQLCGFRAPRNMPGLENAGDFPMARAGRGGNMQVQIIMFIVATKYFGCQ
jgi:hypothetical protein